MKSSIARYVLLTVIATAPAGASDPPQIRLREIARGLALPVGIVSPRDGSTRLFLLEQGGRVRIHDGARLLPTPFLDISKKLYCCGEWGLLGLAFHPQYRKNGRFFLFYTSSKRQLVIAELRVSSNPLLADTNTMKTILSIPHADLPGHNGGQIAFGPDGYLYIAIGDGGRQADPDGFAQRLDSLLGKILRIDVDHGAPYSIPASNPFAGGGRRDDPIWAYGFRNPWRFSFDRLTGDLYISDVGDLCWEELNVQPASSLGGENYGWNIAEGRRCYDSRRTGCNTPPPCDLANLVSPILVYAHTSSCASVTGGYLYRGTRIPPLAGRYLYGDFCSGKIWAASKSGNAWKTQLLLDTRHLITSFGEDEAGEILLASFTDGAVYRIEAAGSR